MLMLTIMMCTYSWIRFCKVRRSPFTFEWYTWLFATGLSLGLVIGIKMVGIFVVSLVGICVLVELWDLATDIKWRVSLVCILSLTYPNLFQEAIWLSFHTTSIVFDCTPDSNVSIILLHPLGDSRQQSRKDTHVPKISAGI
jgi:dolichyl-phosphate-mannose--protein O-mannosyl transferase